MIYDVDRVYTDNPFIDNLIYYSKYLALNSVIKNEDEALRYETASTIKNSDLYILAIEGRLLFELIPSFPLEVLKKSTLNPGYFDQYMVDKNTIPDFKREELRELMKNHIINNYEEENNYYRMITGKPNIGVTGLKIDSEMIPENIRNSIDTKKFIHNMNNNELAILESLGLIKHLRLANPDHRYLDYINCNISIYNARSAVAFQLLYIPGIEYIELIDKFRRKYEQNRYFTLKTIYSEAYKFQSDYYDNFITILILIQTISDMVCEVQEHIVNKEVFDKRCVKYIFQSHGVPFYEDIPIKYQVMMMKNLNKFLKYKSTSKGMVDICSLFGFDNASVFKYYLLRDRKIDPETNDYIFNFKENIIVDSELTEVEKESLVIVTNTFRYALNFPQDNYLENGNKIIITLDKNIVLTDLDYRIEGNELVITNTAILIGRTTLDIEYIYITDGGINVSDKDKYAIRTTTRTMIAEANQKIFKIPSPFENYLKSGGSFIVTLGSIHMAKDTYSINLTEETIIFKNAVPAGQDVNFFFSYSSTLASKFETVMVKATVIKQTNFVIPEPFPGYCDAGNSFFITKNGLYIDDSRYNINNGYLVFLSAEDYVEIDSSLEFVFIYNEYQKIVIEEKREKVAATTTMQNTFTIPFPMENYLESGHVMFIRLRDMDVPSTKYDIYNERLVISDTNLGLLIGQEIEFIFRYHINGPAPKSVNRILVVTEDVQTRFEIPFPFKRYLARGNKAILTKDDIIIDESNYTITDNILEMKNVKDGIDKSDKLMITFIYDQENANTIISEVRRVTLESEGQNIVNIPFPFYGYLESNNKFFISYGSIIIPEKYYTVENKKLTLDPTLNLKDGRDINFIFVYHTIFKDSSKYVDDLEVDIVINDEVSIRIPLPYDNYIKDGNIFKVKIGNKIIDPSNYDILGDELYLHNAKEILGTNNSVKFIFYYVTTNIRKELVEDYEKNFELKFLRVPINESFDKYIKEKSNIEEFDSITTIDEYWAGPNSHEDIKKRLLAKEFNYEISKYISIDTIYELANLGFELPYFFNMLFDDNTMEERLQLSVLNLHPTKSFKLNDLFCYLFSLTYEYNDIADDILDTTGKVLHVKGFNFKADLAEIKSYVKEQIKKGYDLSDLNLDNFEVMKSPVVSINQLIEIFAKNKAIYDHIVYQLSHAENKSIYRIYKKLYDSLMVIEYNTNFFRKPDGTMSTSYTDYLSWRDTILYNSIINVKKISNKYDKQDEIIRLIGMVTDSISIYLTQDRYKYIYHNLPGVSIDYIKGYLTKVLTFFHSYKVQLLNISTIYRINDKLECTVNILDDINLLVDLHFLNYDIIEEYLSKVTDINPKELVSVLEYIKTDIETFIDINKRDRLQFTDKFKSLIVDLLYKSRELNIREKPSSVLVDLKNSHIYDMLDTLITSNDLTVKTRYELLEYITTTIETLASFKIKDIAPNIKKEVVTISQI